jgi:protein phosphatase
MIKIGEVVSFSGLGRRTNNEDSFGIREPDTYLVCDGVGGAAKGEVASRLVVDAICDALAEVGSSAPDELVRAAESRLSMHINEHPEAMGMATTLTLLHIRQEGALVAWVGDSRIYQFRQSRTVFVTRDHSWVNDAVAAGIISAREAIGHPKANVITRAVQGSHQPVHVQYQVLTDVRKDDLFMLCSDGVLESWTDEDLEALLGTEKNGKVQAIAARIEQDCSSHSKDNHTAILLKVEEGADPALRRVNPSHAPQREQHPERPIVERTVKPGWNGANLQWDRRTRFLMAIIMVLLLVVAYLLIPRPDKAQNGNHPPPPVDRAQGPQQQDTPAAVPASPADAAPMPPKTTGTTEQKVTPKEGGPQKP